MRKEPTHWEYIKETSQYNESDYRSRFYKGKWEKAWLKDVFTYATRGDIPLYEAMWLRCGDKLEHMPKRLFKFFPFNHNSLKCIETNAVFVNSPKNFNDPFDSLLCANENEFLKKCLIEHIKKTGAVGRGILSSEELIKLENSCCVEKSIYGNIYKTFDSVVLHLCYDANKNEMKRGASEINDVLFDAEMKYRSTLEKLRESSVRISSFADINEFKLTSYMELWAHYAQNHEGFCVEYDLAEALENQKENAMVSGGLLPCSYGTGQILLSKQKIYKYANGLPLTSHEKMELDKSIMLSFLMKSSSWRYENEWRLILPLDICKIYNNMIPFFRMKAFYIGCRMPRDNKEYLYRIAQRKNITVYNMEMHEHRFELEGDYNPVDIGKYFKEKNDKMDRLCQSKYDFTLLS
ncbi:hypothetical protein ADH76_07905 [Enterocloster clostridioformis]|uniref:DUF2971 domain-containing protein n=1 Tax=Enterocloster clostridioformis TaxID=1531 RepID=UPI00080C5E14|nr:DUF2971 domain-containing protein [Enterocloster clostridioformis]ANU49741.1 hypothetical protein A4V08_31835 [Lachnoclostridium sp. YL32]NDO28787.1 DUF2971 domain-containing protein [Enterocloster clostridioformis]OXE71205.1 hypothetical protein ADH76_07905 [Enterocloster clostridioformis]QQR01350.1 DUF2971 domain-containing protein [Enterocloster clostridioformis]